MHFFEAAYRGAPPWEIGRPQGVFVRLEESGRITGRVLDLGCGTGELALYLAERGHTVVGVDFAPTAIERARRKAAARGASASFRVASALDLPDLGGPFDTVTDCGLFHVFLDPHRPEYAASVARQLRPGGRFFLIAFSEHEPTDWGGPRRVTQAEIRTTFREGWDVESIAADRFETRDPAVTGHAWLATLARRADPGAVPRRAATPVARIRSTRGGPRA
ncbi:MAG TPA: class I SAM-dependent methyltransferase [Thermoplasmata archaeon]|nr:class I SAM-dependent methyltransferase [Thermoplasmata archaeon]